MYYVCVCIYIYICFRERDIDRHIYPCPGDLRGGQLQRAALLAERQLQRRLPPRQRLLMRRGHLRHADRLQPAEASLRVICIYIYIYVLFDCCMYIYIYI